MLGDTFAVLGHEIEVYDECLNHAEKADRGEVAWSGAETGIYFRLTR